MKRTKENWILGQPEDRANISGLRFFDGEDLHSQERKRAFQETQRKWIEEQMKEKQLQQEREREENRLYAFQAAQADRMRGMLEDQLEQKIKQMQVATRDANIELKKQRQTRERFDRSQYLQEEESELSHQMRIRQVDAYDNPLK